MGDILNEDDRPEDFVNNELKNQDPYIISFIANNLWGFLQIYGWGLLLLGVLVFYLKSKIKFNRKRDPAVEAKKYDNEEVRQKHEKMDAARSRMQMIYSQQAMDFIAKKKKMEEEAKRLRLEEWERHQAGLGYMSRSQPTNQPQNPLERAKKKIYQPYANSGNSGFNPLMGNCSGSTYRPVNRRPGGG